MFGYKRHLVSSKLNALSRYILRILFTTNHKVIQIKVGTVPCGAAIERCLGHIIFYVYVLKKVGAFLEVLR